MEWTSLGIDDIFKHFATSKTSGLTAKCAAKQLKTCGLNALVEDSKVSFWQLLINQFNNFMVLILLGAVAISALLGEYIDAIAIVAIIVLNAVLGFVQEVKAEKSLASLKKMSSPVARVLRDSAWAVIDAQTLVPGDIIKLTAGDRIPADVRFLELSTLAADEAMLTGESLPVVKCTTPLIATATADKANMGFMGTMVVKGTGTAVVVATGMTTEMGRIAHLLQQTAAVATPLQLRLEQLGKVLIFLSILLTVLVVITGVWQGHDFYKMVLAGVSLAVAAIPEGLPAIVTVALALGVQRMIKKRAVVRKLPSVETLGCATVICSDKTGTLTQNKMTVTDLWLDKQSLPLAAADEMLSSTWDQLCKIALLCNNAAMTTSKKGTQLEGEPTEQALLVMAGTAGLYADAIAGARLRELPFDSNRKMMSVVWAHQGKTQLYTKGAPDLLLERCSHIMLNGTKQPLTAMLKREIIAANEQLAGRALRNIAFGYRELDSAWSGAPERLERDLIFVGIASMIDPPREQVKESIELCRAAGIRTLMITGDHPATAVAIGAQLGLDTKVLTGTEIDKLKAAALEEAVEHMTIYARVSPEHKLRIVQALQQCGHVVAMTGDGVNDAPAIKAADIGISMGLTGTDVSKDASALVLADDNFATIVEAVKEGRSIYDNIRKFISYLLASNVGEILVMFLTLLVGLPLPLVPTQILWVNLVTDGLPAMALALDPPEGDTMAYGPRNSRESIFSCGIGWKIVTRGLLIGICSLLAFMITYMESPDKLSLAQTVAFATLVLSQLIYVYDCRSIGTIFQRTPFDNLPLGLAVISSVGLLVLAIYHPSLNLVFHTVALGFREWILITVTSTLPVILAGLLDQATRRT